MIRTISGKTINFVDPQEDQICITDIAWALSRECRWANHSRQRYTVAEHCVQMSYLSENPKEALMHDATEAYMRDIPSPLKKILPGYQELEDRLQKTIFHKFGLEEIPAEVHYWDKELAAIEYENVVISDNWTALNSADAFFSFINRFKELWNTK